MPVARRWRNFLKICHWIFANACMGIHFPWHFPDFSQTNRISWLFPDFCFRQMEFPDFSLTSLTWQTPCNRRFVFGAIFHILNWNNENLKKTKVEVVIYNETKIKGTYVLWHMVNRHISRFPNPSRSSRSRRHQLCLSEFQSHTALH